MIYSRSAEYAIRAFVHLAQVNEGKYAMVKNIAEQEDIPAHFLAKILQQLARKGLLRSSKGPTGGFALRVDPSEIRLLDIVEALDGLAPYQQCASGLSARAKNSRSLIKSDSRTASSKNDSMTPRYWLAGTGTGV